MTVVDINAALKKVKFDVIDVVPCPIRDGVWVVYVRALPKTEATSEKRCAKVGLTLRGVGWENGRSEFIEVSE